MSYPIPKRTVLRNGIRLLTIPMRGVPTVTAMVLVEAGSRYESAKDNGLSHFLEHMCFKGTTRRPSAKLIAIELETLGAEYNAFTGEEFTGYWAKARIKHFTDILDVVADLYLDPLLPQKELEKERGVIIEEINMYEDLPQVRVQWLLDELMYDGQPAGRPIVGPKENILRFMRRDFARYRTAHYTGTKTAVIIAGGLSNREMTTAAEAAFAGAPKGKRALRATTKERQAAPAFRQKERQTDQTHFVIGFRSYALSDKRQSAARLLAGVLGKGMSSRLFHRLREEMGVCYYIKATQESMTDTGVLKIFAGVNTRRVEEVIGVIMEELRAIRDTEVPKGELERVKEMIIGAIALGLETSDQVADWYHEEILRQPLETPAEAIRKIRVVTAKDVQKAARDIFVDPKLNLALIGPKRDLGKLKKTARI
ncbi:MAG TPA: pitrilysin family protein [Candidatus Paceibacterota bacterium]|nr:pitrilysin family protein [Candidatus Paceibacterota bacterium]